MGKETPEVSFGSAAFVNNPVVVNPKRWSKPFMGFLFSNVVVEDKGLVIIIFGEHAGGIVKNESVRPDGAAAAVVVVWVWLSGIVVKGGGGGAFFLVELSTVDSSFLFKRDISVTGAAGAGNKVSLPIS